MLKSKIVHLKEIYKFDFDYFLIKRTVFVLIVKNFTKNQKINFPDHFDHFLIKCTVFVLIVINTIKNQKFNFLDKLYGISNNVRLQIKVVAFKKFF